MVVTAPFATVEMCSEICEAWVTGRSETQNPRVQALEGSIPADKCGSGAYLSLLCGSLVLLPGTCASFALVAMEFRAEPPTISGGRLGLLLFPLQPDLVCFLTK